MLLSPTLGRERAQQLLEEATDPGTLDNKTLSEVLSQMPEVRDQMRKQDLRSLEDPEQYIGQAREFTSRLIRPARTQRNHWPRKPRRK
jgi:adenylosuccinate lyase